MSLFFNKKKKTFQEELCQKGADLRHLIEKKLKEFEVLFSEEMVDFLNSSVRDASHHNEELPK